MSHEEQCPTEGEQKFLEPGNGIDIQVVRGLVEEQEIRCVCQCLCQQNTSLETARKFRELNVFGKLQSRQYLINALLHLPPARCLELVLHILELGHQLLAVVMGQFGAHVMIGGKQFPLLAKGARYHVEHVAEKRIGNLLRQERGAHALLEHDIAAVWLYLSGDELHDSGLASAVPSDQTDPLTAVDGEIDSFEQQRPAEADLDVL